MASLLVVAALLAAAMPWVARLTGAPSRGIGDLYWYAGVAFVVVGRLAYVAAEASPSSLLDVAVIVRIQGGVSPLAGAVASAVVAIWFLRGAPRMAWPTWLGVWALGLSLATLGYDLACPLRNACYGSALPAPFGFPMAGLADPRAPTPLFEAVALLLVLGVLVLSWPRWRPGVAGLVALGSTAALRLGFTALSVTGWEGTTAESLALAASVAAALGGTIVLQSFPADEAPA